MEEISARRCLFSVVLASIFFGCILHSSDCFRYGAVYDGDSEVEFGFSFQIRCKITTKDSPKWTINGIEITDDNDLGYTLESRKTGRFGIQMTLGVTSAQLHHEGEYRCNAYSRDFHFLEVINEDEENDEKKKETAANEFILKVNKTITLDCLSAKDKNVPITWHKDSKRVSMGIKSNIRLYNQSLVIEKAQEDDAGEYMCLQENVPQTGLSYIGHILLVRSPVNIVDTHFFLTKDSSHTLDFGEKAIIMKGETVTLHCKANGFPIPSIRWFIGNELVEEIMKVNSRIRIYSDGLRRSNLTIISVDILDKGLYTCQANNSMDGKTSEFDEMSLFVYVRV